MNTFDRKVFVGQQSLAGSRGIEKDRDRPAINTNGTAHAE